MRRIWREYLWHADVRALRGHSWSTFHNDFGAVLGRSGPVLPLPHSLMVRPWSDVTSYPRNSRCCPLISKINVNIRNGERTISRAVRNRNVEALILTMFKDTKSCGDSASPSLSLSLLWKAAASIYARPHRQVAYIFRCKLRQRQWQAIQ